jgi:hypothetical protein
MTTTTFDHAAAVRAAIPTRPVRKTGFWKRVFDALVEARMRQVQREIERVRHLMPSEGRNDRAA